MSNENKVQYREQKAKIRTFHDKVNSEGAVVKKVMVKQETTGVMASLGQWSAWGADRATALLALKQMRGKSTNHINLVIENQS